MSRHKRKAGKKFERYSLERSPFAQKPTQRQLAALLGLKRDELRRLANRKEEFVVRREIESRGKTRKLAYPRGQLRTVHEILKFHLKKIQQAGYLFSPRSGRSQRDNALYHAGRNQFFLFDIKQFYPSTTREHVFRWAVYELGMLHDVAGLFCEIVTIDGTVSFGSPATPVLVSLVHRKMFDEIEAECRARGLLISLWVDDIVISGRFVPGTLVLSIREIVRRNGLKSHKLEFRTASRPVVLTGVPIRRGVLDAPTATHLRVRDGYRDLNNCSDPEELRQTIDRLLSVLGSVRYVVGSASPLGRKTADRMSALRRKREAASSSSKTAAVFAHQANFTSGDGEAESPF